jgi:hypothetical protein
MRFSLVLVALAVSSIAFAQQDRIVQVGYAANLNIGDSVLSLSNDGRSGGVFGNIPAPFREGNICANIYVFDPQEEEIGCCACLVTPNGLNSLSVKSDLISNNLTPAVPTSVTIMLINTAPGNSGTGAAPVFNECNPATAATAANGRFGILAWGTTLEPSSTPGTYNSVPVQYLQTSVVGLGPGTEPTGVASLCNFIQANGTGFGICKSCRLGALGGAKQ